jgi:hypothetical protein
VPRLDGRTVSSDRVELSPLAMADYCFVFDGDGCSVRIDGNIQLKDRIRGYRAIRLHADDFKRLWLAQKIIAAKPSEQEIRDTILEEQTALGRRPTMVQALDAVKKKYVAATRAPVITIWRNLYPVRKQGPRAAE